MELAVGQKLWFVPNRKRSNAREVTIAKIGRKWITTTEDDAMRLDVKTLQADGYWTGCAYLSQQHYEESEAIKKAWSDLCDKMKWYNQPDGITVEEITEARNLLGL